MRCDCLQVFNTDYCTEVCFECGLEKPISFSLMQSTCPRDKAPFPTGYSKIKRFTKILDCVLRPTPSPADAQMLQLLSGKPRFDSIPDMMAAMKLGTFRDKRYISLHLFARLFLRDYTTPVTTDRSVRKRILMQFERIQFGHLRYTPSQQFFNYSWLLSVLLVECGLSEHVKYIKNLRCKHRKQFYTDLLEQIRNAYNEIGDQVCALATRKPRVALSGDPPRHRFPTHSLPANCETLLRQYRLAQLGGGQSSCEE